MPKSPGKSGKDKDRGISIKGKASSTTTPSSPSKPRKPRSNATSRSATPSVKSPPPSKRKPSTLAPHTGSSFFVDLSLLSEDSEDEEMNPQVSTPQAGPSRQVDRHEERGSNLFRSIIRGVKDQEAASREPSTPQPDSYRPTAFTPLNRSIISSVERPTRSPSPGVVDTGIIEIEEVNTPRVRRRGGHFDPPALFSTSIDPGVVQDGNKFHVTLASADQDKATSQEVDGLLLPAHVVVRPRDEGQAEETDEEVIDMEGVHFLDDDRSKGVARYFVSTDPESEEAVFLANADQRMLCRKCKRPGHKEFECPHIICTTCGKEDEHERKDCPMGMVCFGCGQRGHRRGDCPTPSSRSNRGGSCRKCSGWDHTENTCPTLWRIYVYRSEKGQKRELEHREDSSKWEREAIGGDVEDEWCYNCAKEGHLGEECTLRRGSLGRSITHSAFSHFTASSGPFALSRRRYGGQGLGAHTRFGDEKDSDRRHERSQRGASPLPYVARGFEGEGAGRKGREKERERMRDRDRQRTRDDDEEEFLSRVSKRPWNSERRDYDRRDRDRHRDRGRDSDRRDRSRSRSPQRLPFGHKNLIDRISGSPGPGSAPPRTSISFGKLNMSPGPDNTPTGPRSRPAQVSILGRARGALDTGSPARRSGPVNLNGNGRDKANQPARPSPLATSTQPAPSEGTSKSAIRRRRRQLAGKEEGEISSDTDPEERAFRNSGNGGGNVEKWGQEMDKEVKEKKAQGNKGQKYTGGY